MSESKRGNVFEKINHLYGKKFLVGPQKQRTREYPFRKIEQHLVARHKASEQHNEKRVKEKEREKYEEKIRYDFLNGQHRECGPFPLRLSVHIKNPPRKEQTYSI